MKMTRLSLIFAALLSLFGAQAMAQVATTSSDDIRVALTEALPDWWVIESFESNAAEPSSATDDTDSKDPATLTSTTKPRHRALDPAVTHVFTADVELTQDLFEASYSEGGATFVQEIMPSGARVRITGTYAGTRSEPIQLNQDGLATLGAPLDGFDTTAYVLGSTEADAFLETLEAARVRGTFSKLMNDQGDEL